MPWERSPRFEDTMDVMGKCSERLDKSGFRGTM